MVTINMGRQAIYKPMHEFDNLFQGTYGTGKTGKTWKMAKKNHCQGKHREFGILPKHRKFGLLKL